MFDVVCTVQVLAGKSPLYYRALCTERTLLRVRIVCTKSELFSLSTLTFSYPTLVRVFGFVCSATGESIESIVMVLTLSWAMPIDWD